MSDDEKSGLGEFSARLESDDIDVVRGALDDYQSAQATTRWGVDNPYWPLADEVRFAARDLLRQLPSGHSHASALTVMWHLAEEEDADLIADALEGAPDAEVREMALLAAGTALAAGEEPNRRLLALITAMVLDEGLDVRDRKDAMQALDDLDLPEVEDLLVRLSESSELELQVCAAGCLATPLRLRVHRDRVRRLAKSWPKDAGWEAAHIREAVEGFHSTYWKDTELNDPVLRKAHDELRFPLSDEGCLQAFATLLRSEDPVAVGIALDHYESSEGLCYVLEDEERAEAYLPEVLARAREVLRRPMSPAEVSALNMIGARHGEPGDAGLLLDALTRTDSDAVREEAIWMAYGVLDEAEVKDERLVAALGDLIFDPSVGFYLTKETAIRVLADSLGTDADDILLRALREGEPKVQAHASYFLIRTGGLDRHRAILEEVAESWGDRPPQRPWGKDPIELIFGKPHSVHWEGHRLADPDLYRAHKRLRAPTVDESYHRALRMLLESDDEAAVGIALDHWWSADGAVKRGGEEAREPERALVLDRIREALRQPPSPAKLSRMHGPEAKHLTALSALDVVAAEEPYLLAEVVEAAASDHVRQRALYAVEAVFKDAEEADLRLVEALGNVACDENVPLNDRVRALELLDESPGTNSVDALVRATRCPEVEVQAAAAWGLVWDEVIEDHRAMLEELSANWPVEDAPWEVTRVRDTLNAAKE
ncbi:HEAT repeat domain-containing protein [Streptomyces sp. NPDC048473]|uniref:HEAT repeat domain-containing protein n=1 Tax=unclassified Streptomyces TaxID=2593676 RepID=UPI00371D5926